MSDHDVPLSVMPPPDMLLASYVEAEVPTGLGREAMLLVEAQERATNEHRILHVPSPPEVRPMPWAVALMRALVLDDAQFMVRSWCLLAEARVWEPPPGTPLPDPNDAPDLEAMEEAGHPGIVHVAVAAWAAPHRRQVIMRTASREDDGTVTWGDVDAAGVEHLQGWVRDLLHLGSDHCPLP